MHSTKNQTETNQTQNLAEVKMQVQQSSNEMEAKNNNNTNQNSEEVMSAETTSSTEVVTNQTIQNSTTNPKVQMESVKSTYEPEIEQVVYSEANTTQASFKDEDPKYRRANARKTASLRNIRMQKMKALKSLRKNIKDIRNTIKRGYYIFEKELVKGDLTSNVKIHHNLDDAEKEFLRKKREQLKVEFLELQGEIGEYTANLKSLSHRTKMSYSNKYSQMVWNNKIKKSTNRIRGIIEKQLEKDAKNGRSEQLKQISIEANEQNQKQSFMEYISTIITPKDKKLFEIPQLQESVTKRGILYLKEIEF